MNLDNFSEQLKTTIDAAFNYAKENNFAYFTSLHILIVLIQSDKLVLEILDYFNVDSKLLLKESIKTANENLNNSKDTKVQSNIVLLLNNTNDKITNYPINNVESLLMLMELTTDLSPITKRILNKFNLNIKTWKHF